MVMTLNEVIQDLQKLANEHGGDKRVFLRNYDFEFEPVETIYLDGDDDVVMRSDDE